MRIAGRQTNLALLAALALAVATGAGAMATGSARGRWVVVAHGVVGVVVVLLIPWKTRVVRAGTRRRRGTRWLSYALAALAIVALLAGFGASTGLVRSVGGIEAMWFHVAAALAVVPLVTWHVVARPARPRRADLSRRTLVRAGVLAGVAAAGYGLVELVVRLAPLRGAARRFTGSYEIGSGDPDAMPNTI
jgi:hypothetical protein